MSNTHTKTTLPEYPNLGFGDILVASGRAAPPSSKNVRAPSRRGASKKAKTGDGGDTISYEALASLIREHDGGDTYTLSGSTLEAIVQDAQNYVRAGAAMPPEYPVYRFGDVMVVNDKNAPPARKNVRLRGKAKVGGGKISYKTLMDLIREHGRGVEFALSGSTLEAIVEDAQNYTKSRCGRSYSKLSEQKHDEAEARAAAQNAAIKLRKTLDQAHAQTRLADTNSERMADIASSLMQAAAGVVQAWRNFTPGDAEGLDNLRKAIEAADKRVSDIAKTKHGRGLLDRQPCVRGGKRRQSKK